MVVVEPYLVISSALVKQSGLFEGGYGVEVCINGGHFLTYVLFASKLSDPVLCKGLHKYLV